MKKITGILLTFILTATALYAQKTDKSDDEKAIRANVEIMMNSWNAKSGEQFAKPFAEDADYVVINGTQIKGRAVIAKAHQGIFDTIYKNTTLLLSTDSIRFLRSDIAVVHVSGSLKLVEQSSTRTNYARMTMVMVKTGEKWEIAAFQNTQIEK